MKVLEYLQTDNYKRLSKEAHKLSHQITMLKMKLDAISQEIEYDMRKNNVDYENDHLNYNDQ